MSDKGRTLEVWIPPEVIKAMQGKEGYVHYVVVEKDDDSSRKYYVEGDEVLSEKRTI